MLEVPKSLLHRWSDYRPALIKSDALLQCCLEDDPATRPARLNLAEVHRHGWRSREARPLYAEAGARLVHWCVTNERYLNNVAIQQDIGIMADHDLLCTPIFPGGTERSTLRQRIGDFLATRVPGLRAAPGARRTVAMPIYQRRLFGELPSWSMAARTLDDGALVLVDAPLCLAGADGPPGAFLCDYPDFLRRPDDVRVPLTLSDEGGQTLNIGPRRRRGLAPLQSRSRYRPPWRQGRRRPGAAGRAEGAHPGRTPILAQTDLG